MIAVAACLVILGFISIANLLLTVALAKRLAQAPPKPGLQRVGTLRTVGSATPEFSVMTDEELPLNSVELQNTTTLFGFFSTDCGGCRDAMPEFAAHASGAEGAVVAVITGDIAAAGDLASPLRVIAASVVIGAEAAKLHAAFDVDLYPQFYLAANGKISSAAFSLRQLRAHTSVP